MDASEKKTKYPPPDLCPLILEGVAVKGADPTGASAAALGMLEGKEGTGGSGRRGVSMQCENTRLRAV